MKASVRFFLFNCFSLCSFLLLSNITFSQSDDFVGIKIQSENGKTATQTIPSLNKSDVQSLEDYLDGIKPVIGEKYVMGGQVIWNTQDPAAIATSVRLDGDGSSALTAWTLNNQRVSLYGDVNSTPLWQFFTPNSESTIDISGDGATVVAAAGHAFYLLNHLTGNIDYQYDLPDSLLAVNVGVSRDGGWAVLLASPINPATTALAIGFSLSGTPSVAWTKDVPMSVIGNWAGVNFAAYSSIVVINGRYTIHVLNVEDGSAIWEGVADNTESPVAVSGDGKVIATADNSGFVQTRVFNPSNNEYELIWQYRVPAGIFTNWASSVGISADGQTIVAGTLMFLTSSTYDGWVIAFDTYGEGTPKWIYTGLGDLVDDISVSDDGRVAAAATWGDFYQSSRQNLFVFDVATGQPTFQVATPGSFVTCDISHDGKRVFAGGKAVHSREFGNGGRIYLCQIDLGGGNVSGNVDLTNTSDDSGVIVRAAGTTRFAVTDSNGDYLIQNIPTGTYTITAEKPGYNFGNLQNINVTEGNTTAGVNFTLAPFTVTPPTLSASTNMPDAVLLSWSALKNDIRRQIEIARAVGDIQGNDNETSSIPAKNNDQKDDLGINDFSFNGLDSIAIYRGPVSGGPYTKIASVASSESGYADSSVFPLRDYYYVINVFNNIGQSIYSNEALGRLNDSTITSDITVPQGSLPTIDGVISPGEWDDAIKVDISDIFGYGSGDPKPKGSVFMYFKFDDNNDMLYVAGEDFLNTTLDDAEGIGLYFDDNNNDVYDDYLPYIQEGNFWAYWHPGGSDLRFRDLITYEVTTITDGEVEFSDVSGHLQGEVAIPMGFLEGYQLQVFAPDKTPGLGGFIIERQAGNAIFNGWWPQTMNSLFIPRYFGNVGINVHLDAPPQTPSNISVTQQGNSLLVQWDDPTLGLNNDPLPVPPEINIYKNGTLFTTLSAGVEQYLDSDVNCAAWYNYQLEATITVNTTTYTSPLSQPYGAFACFDPVLVPITYDDGGWEVFYIVDVNFDDNKFGVRFTPSNYPTRVARVSTLVNGTAPFDFTINADDNGTPGITLAGPYRVSAPGPTIPATVTFTIPGNDPPTIEQGDFWVEINYLPDSPTAPGIGADLNPPIAGRSFYFLRASGWQPMTTVNLMVTAYVTDSFVNVDEQENSLPLTFDLQQNYPNPFNPSTIISYQIPQNGFVKLDIFDALGQKVRTLVNSDQNAGYYQVEWNGKNDSGSQVTSGVYLCKIQAGSFNKVMKMMMLK